MALLEHLVDDRREIVTVITGAEADAAVTPTCMLAGLARPSSRPDVSRSRCTAAASRSYPYLFGSSDTGVSARREPLDARATSTAIDVGRV